MSMLQQNLTPQSAIAARNVMALNGPDGRTLSNPPFAGANPNLPFSLTGLNCDRSGQKLAELGSFPSLADAMLFAVTKAPGGDTSGQILAILDRDDRLVLAGQFLEGAVAWCNPVTSSAEARQVVLEASRLRGQAMRAGGWQDQATARRLRHSASLLEGRLVDPFWRAFATAALQVAA